MSPRKVVSQAATLPGDLLGRVVTILEDARQRVASTVDSEMVLAYWLIEREIVQALQGGQDRAGYGQSLLDGLASELTTRFGRGFSATSLKNCCLFYQAYAERQPEIRQTASDESSPSGFLAELSWSHCVFLTGLRNADERRFYEIEAARGAWTLAQMRSQFDSGLFERLALCQDPQAIGQLATEGGLSARSPHGCDPRTCERPAGVFMPLEFIQAQAIVAWRSHEAMLAHPHGQPAQKAQVGLDRGRCQVLLLPDPHHGPDVLLPQVARVRHRLEPGLGLQATKEAPQELGAFLPGLVRDSFGHRCVQGVEQLDQYLQHLQRRCLACGVASQEFLRRLARPALPSRGLMLA